MPRARIAWPEPFTVEAQSCGYLNAAWIPDKHKLFLCYELAPGFRRSLSRLRRYASERAQTQVEVKALRRRRGRPRPITRRQILPGYAHPSANQGAHRPMTPAAFRLKKPFFDGSIARKCGVCFALDETKKIRPARRRRNDVQPRKADPSCSCSRRAVRRRPLDQSGRFCRQRSGRGQDCIRAGASRSLCQIVQSRAAPDVHGHQPGRRAVTRVEQPAAREITRCRASATASRASRRR